MNRPAIALHKEPITQEDWLDARSLGLLLKVSEKTLCRWRKAGLFQAGGALATQIPQRQFAGSLSPASLQRRDERGHRPNTPSPGIGLSTLADPSAALPLDARQVEGFSMAAEGPLAAAFVQIRTSGPPGG